MASLAMRMQSLGRGKYLFGILLVGILTTFRIDSFIVSTRISSFQVSDTKDLSSSGKIYSTTLRAPYTNDKQKMPAPPSLPSRQPYIYLCGWLSPSPESQLLLLFPNHKFMRLNEKVGLPDLSTVLPNDILMTSEVPYCCEKAWKDLDEYFEWIPKFPGKVLYRNAESYDKWRGDIPANMYRAGSYPDSKQNRTIRFTEFQGFMVKVHSMEEWDKLFDPEKRPISTQEKFLVYGHSHCLQHRQKALELLAEISRVDCSGTCCNELPDNVEWDSPPSDSALNRGMFGNKEGMSSYRFCLVMENADVEGYFTEKMLHAFLAGCVPIWWGNRETAFDMINKNAIIYFDIDNPQPALDEVRYLESNRTAYMEKLRQPILAKGQETIDKYFSFTPDSEVVRRFQYLMDLT